MFNHITWLNLKPTLSSVRCFWVQQIIANATWVEAVEPTFNSTFDLLNLQTPPPPEWPTLFACPSARDKPMEKLKNHQIKKRRGNRRGGCHLHGTTTNQLLGLISIYIYTYIYIYILYTPNTLAPAHLTACFPSCKFRLWFVRFLPLRDCDCECEWAKHGSRKITPVGSEWRSSDCVPHGRALQGEGAVGGRVGEGEGCGGGGCHSR